MTKNRVPLLKKKVARDDDDNDNRYTYNSLQRVTHHNTKHMIYTHLCRNTLIACNSTPGYSAKPISTICLHPNTQTLNPKNPLENDAFSPHF